MLEQVDTTFDGGLLEMLKSAQAKATNPFETVSFDGSTLERIIAQLEYLRVLAKGNKDALFPVIMPHELRYRGAPIAVPFSWLAPHEAQAFSNHSQSLTTLKRRGGCDPREIWAIIHDTEYKSAPPLDLCLGWLKNEASKFW